jgi:hypothetical protein
MDVVLTDQLLCSFQTTKYFGCGVSIDVDGWIEFNPFDTSTLEVIRSTTFRFQSLILFNLYLFFFYIRFMPAIKPFQQGIKQFLGSTDSRGGWIPIIALPNSFGGLATFRWRNCMCRCCKCQEVGPGSCIVAE